jgi:hypothetical protein
LRNTKENMVLWVVIAACAVFIVLWVCGVRFPRPVAPVPQEFVELEEADDIEPMAPLKRLNMDFDMDLPEEPEVVNDGRDPEGLPL